MKEFGLIGYPLSHSFSQRYFTEKFSRERIDDCLYSNFPLPDISGLPDLIHAHPFLKGFNVTIPYKVKILPFLDGHTDVVKATEACNTVSIKEGKLYGHNTDVYGFKSSLMKYLKDHHTHALILGEGGAAKAVAYVLGQLGIEYYFVSRRGPGHDRKIYYGDLTCEIINGHQLIINCTPLGTFPDIEEAPPIKYDCITGRHYLFDLIYNPSKTLFLQYGEDKGAAIQNGMDMLISQAEESWRFWNTENC